MTTIISSFPWVPPFAQGHVKDLRPRWALQEAGMSYEVELVRDADGAYRQWQPFGQVPAYRDEAVRLHESGAILLRIAERSDLLRQPSEQAMQTERAWVFAALNSLEPKIDNLVLPDIFHAGEPWVDGFRPAARRLAEMRLTSLARAMDGRTWLSDRFGVADIMMATVLRAVQDHEILAPHPTLRDYLDRCLARPAFAQALQAQLDTFAANAPEATAE